MAALFLMAFCALDASGYSAFSDGLLSSDKGTRWNISAKKLTIEEDIYLILV